MLPEIAPHRIPTTSRTAPPPRYDGVNVVRGFRAATLLNAVIAPAELATLRRVNAPKPDSGAVNFERIAINDACLPNQVTGERG
jgi:hypothetical protein